MKLRDVQCIGSAWEELPPDLFGEALVHPTAGTFFLFLLFLFLPPVVSYTNCNKRGPKTKAKVDKGVAKGVEGP